MAETTQAQPVESPELKPEPQPPVFRPPVQPPDANPANPWGGGGPTDPIIMPMPGERPGGRGPIEPRPLPMPPEGGPGGVVIQPPGDSGPYWVDPGNPAAPPPNPVDRFPAPENKPFVDSGAINRRNVGTGEGLDQLTTTPGDISNPPTTGFGPGSGGPGSGPGTPAGAAGQYGGTNEFDPVSGKWTLDPRDPGAAALIAKNPGMYQWPKGYKPPGTAGSTGGPAPTGSVGVAGQTLQQVAQNAANNTAIQPIVNSQQVSDAQKQPGSYIIAPDGTIIYLAKPVTVTAPPATTQPAPKPTGSLASNNPAPPGFHWDGNILRPN